jgi:alkylation response protein AidB-like acyl-CoA dehydrogenase
MDEIFIQNEEQRAIIDSVRRFVEEEVTQRAAELDAQTDPEDCFSW